MLASSLISHNLLGFAVCYSRITFEVRHGFEILRFKCVWQVKITAACDKHQTAAEGQKPTFVQKWNPLHCRRIGSRHLTVSERHRVPVKGTDDVKERSNHTKEVQEKADRATKLKDSFADYFAFAYCDQWNRNFQSCSLSKFICKLRTFQLSCLKTKQVATYFSYN